MLADSLWMIPTILILTYLNLKLVKFTIYILDRKHLSARALFLDLAEQTIKFIRRTQLIISLIILFMNFRRRNKIMCASVKTYFININNSLFNKIKIYWFFNFNKNYYTLNKFLTILYNQSYNIFIKQIILLKITNIVVNSLNFILFKNFFKTLISKINFLNKFLNNSIKFIPVFLFTPANNFTRNKNITVFRSKIKIPNFFINSIFVFYKNIKSIFLPALLSIIFFIILLDFFSVDFLRQTGVWAVFGFLAFWLFSSFNFFLKRYRFGKFTSSIQRFWKRTNVYFWVIEGFMFSLFFYYYLNSSQEPIYMYDESNLNQQFLPSLLVSYQAYLILLFIFFYTIYLLLALPTFKSTQQILHLGVMTLLYTYIYLLENYQVYYILTSFYENYWVYDAEQLLWSLEIEVPRIRTKQQYFFIALILKYWHFVFIYLSWLFVVMKSFEKKQISFVLLGLSSQNVLILFFLNILFNAQWLKWMIKRFGETAYYWFFTASNESTLLTFYQELIIICLLYIL